MCNFHSQPHQRKKKKRQTNISNQIAVPWINCPGIKISMCFFSFSLLVLKQTKAAKKNGKWYLPLVWWWCHHRCCYHCYCSGSMSSDKYSFWWHERVAVAGVAVVEGSVTVPVPLCWLLLLRRLLPLLRPLPLDTILAMNVIHSFLISN